MPFANRFFRERFGDPHGKRCYEYLFGLAEPWEICETYKVQDHETASLGVDRPGTTVITTFTTSLSLTLTIRTHILEMGIDITEVKNAERALKELNETLEQRVADRTAELAESEGRLRLFIEHAPAALAMLDREMRYMSVEQMAGRLWH